MMIASIVILTHPASKSKNVLSLFLLAGLLATPAWAQTQLGTLFGTIGQKIGRFEMADMGTLFLDEIGDIPLPLQPKLLRVLQEKEFERLVSGRPPRVNIRLVAATHRDLSELVARSQFRIDLYYRLNVFS